MSLVKLVDTSEGKYIAFKSEEFVWLMGITAVLLILLLIAVRLKSTRAQAALVWILHIIWGTAIIPNGTSLTEV